MKNKISNIINFVKNVYRFRKPLTNATWHDAGDLEHMIAIYLGMMKEGHLKEKESGNYWGSEATSRKINNASALIDDLIAYEQDQPFLIKNIHTNEIIDISDRVSLFLVSESDQVSIFKKKIDGDRDLDDVYPASDWDYVYSCKVLQRKRKTFYQYLGRNLSSMWY